MGHGKKQRRDIKVTGELGNDIRSAREARKIGQKALGSAAGYSESYVSRVEGGTVIPSQKFVEGCDRAFGTGTLFQRQLRRAVEGEHPAWFAPYIDAEKDATEVRDFSTVFIMGLLQTEEYARAVLQRGHLPISDEEIEARVTSRMRRREIFEKSKPPRVWVVLHEASLQANMGSPSLMAHQLGFLLGEVTRLPTLSVQVLPFTAAAAAMGTPYTYLEIPDTGPVVYVEGPQGGRPYNAPSVTRHASDFYDHLRVNALSPHDSVAYITRVRNEHARNAVDQVELQRQPGRPVRRVGPGSRSRRRHPRPRQQGHHPRPAHLPNHRMGGVR